MDGFQATITSLAIIAIVLLMVLFVCHLFGPKASAWVCSNREEKIGLSKNKLFNANGYLIHSGSEILLSSTGSFKRFDSIDHDYKEIHQTSLTSPTWNVPIPDIPPQPLRPAPAPSTKEIKRSIDKSVKQQSCDTIIPTSNTAIPRPIAKRQLSSPAGTIMPINLSDAAIKISNGPRSCTNPFLSHTFSIPEQDNLFLDKQSNPQISTTKTTPQTQQVVMSSSSIFTTANECEKENLNPFSRQYHQNDDENCFKFPNIQNNDPNHIDRLIEDAFCVTKINTQSSNLQNFVDNVDSDDSKKLPENVLIHQNNGFVTKSETNNRIVRNKKSSNCGTFRNRSLSETTEVIENELLQLNVNGDKDSIIYHNNCDSTSNTNPFRSNLHKTLSETYLEQYLLNSKHRYSASQMWMFSKSLSRQSSNVSLTKSLGSQSSIMSSENGYSGNETVPDIKRAMSCDSVSSDSSVVLADLEQPVPSVTGMLCVGLQYDKKSHRDGGVELIVTIMEAKDLLFPSNTTTFDTFVRIYLVPDETEALQTKTFKNTECPTYNETFSFWLNKKRSRRSLWFHLYHSGNVHTLLGESELKITDVSRPITTWLSLSDSRHNHNIWGELMFSLSYLPTAERLTVVVVKARNLKLNQDDNESSAVQNVFVKVYLLKNDKKVYKKKTCTKRTDRSPIYNESMIFSVPPYMLGSIQIRLTVSNVSDLSPDYIGTSSSNNGGIATISSIGHVIVGSSTTGKGLRHWNQMLSSLRKPVAMWHAIRQINRGKTDNNKQIVEH